MSTSVVVGSSTGNCAGSAPALPVARLATVTPRIQGTRDLLLLFAADIGGWVLFRRHASRRFSRYSVMTLSAHSTIDTKMAGLPISRSKAPGRVLLGRLLSLGKTDSRAVAARRSAKACDAFP